MVSTCLLNDGSVWARLLEETPVAFTIRHPQAVQVPVPYSHSCKISNVVPWRSDSLQRGFGAAMRGLQLCNALSAVHEASSNSRPRFLRIVVLRSRSCTQVELLVTFRQCNFLLGLQVSDTRDMCRWGQRGTKSSDIWWLEFEVEPREIKAGKSLSSATYHANDF